MSAGQQIRKGLAKEADKLRGRDMSDPQSYCPFCKGTHDALEFIETLERIAELEAIIDKGLDEGYIPNEWLQAEQANSEVEK